MSLFIVRISVVYAGWYQPDIHEILEKGDVVSYTSGNPEYVKSDDVYDSAGFIINAYAGKTVVHMAKHCSRDINCVVWKRMSGPRKPIRLPLNPYHSKPLPLP